MSNNIRCYHYNSGYCKNKNKCTFIHYIEECETKCNSDQCMKRHKRKCKDGQYCYYNSINTCEYSHDSQENVNIEYNENVILKNENDDLKIQIEQQKEINNKLYSINESNDELLKNQQINIDEYLENINNLNNIIENKIQLIKEIEINKEIAIKHEHCEQHIKYLKEIIENRATQSYIKLDNYKSDNFSDYCDTSNKETLVESLMKIDEWNPQFKRNERNYLLSNNVKICELKK